MLHVIAMSSGKSFWSKPRNRGLVYALGFVIVFASYVIGSPDAKRVASQKRLKSQISSEGPSIENIDISQEEQKAPQENQQLVAKNDAIVIGPKATVPNKDYPSTFNPFDRELSEKEQANMVKELTKGPVPYPYEISQEALDLAEKDRVGQLTPAQMARRVALALEPRKKIKESESENQLAKKEKNTPYNHSQASWIRNNTSLALNPENSAGTEDEKYKLGTVEDKNRTNYVNSHGAVPAGLEYTHEFLEVYQFLPGQNAGLIPNSWKQPNLYKSLKPSNYNGLHDHYRIPPDWDNQFKFADNPLEEVGPSQDASNAHLLSLGTNGAVIFVVRDGSIVNDTGADFVIWGHPGCYIKNEQTEQEMKDGKRTERPTYTPKNGRAITGIENNVECLKELAQVYVSETWPDFDWEAIEPCQKSGDENQSRCAGFGLNLWTQSQNLRNDSSGGDRYDLGDLNKQSIRAIKIQDLGNPGAFEKAGFDLDAIAMINFKNEKKGSSSK